MRKLYRSGKSQRILMKHLYEVGDQLSHKTAADLGWSNYSVIQAAKPLKRRGLLCSPSLDHFELTAAGREFTEMENEYR